MPVRPARCWAGAPRPTSASWCARWCAPISPAIFLWVASLMSELFDLKGKRVWVAGHNGMVGGALLRRLASEGCELLTAARGELDLTRQAEVEGWVQGNRPDAVIVAAAKV